MDTADRLDLGIDLDLGVAKFSALFPKTPAITKVRPVEMFLLYRIIINNIININYHLT